MFDWEVDDEEDEGDVGFDKKEMISYALFANHAAKYEVLKRSL